jgi:hypothetical protein
LEKKRRDSNGTVYVTKCESRPMYKGSTETIRTQSEMWEHSYLKPDANGKVTQTPHYWRL